LVLPVTVAVNCWVPPVSTEAEVGLMLTATTGGGALTVTVAEADFVLSATLVARTLKVPAVAGAVYRPAGEIVPPVADHVTAVLVVPVIVAVNCWVPPVCNDAEVGLRLMVTTGGGAVTITVAADDLLGSATLVAMTVKVPVVLGAV